jgi:hypothetical protein
MSGGQNKGNRLDWVFFKCSTSPLAYVSIFIKKIGHSQLCLYLCIWRFELQVSACYSHHEASLKNMSTETLLFRKGKAFHFTILTHFEVESLPLCEK